MPLVSEIVAVDSRSSDGTRAAAAAGRARRVVQDHEILPDLPPGRGKGEALWKSLAVLRGDIVVWLDSDVVDFDPAFVTGLVGPLLDRPGGGLREGPLPARAGRRRRWRRAASPRSARGR